jgi:hypothetical protein
VTEAITDQFDEQERQVIAQAPVLIFLLVSAADGTIDKREVKGFESILTSPPYADLLLLMGRARLSVVDTLRQLTENPVDYLAELQRIDRVLETRLSLIEAQQLKLQLYDLAQAVAAASGGFMGVMGNPIGDQEQTALKVIAGIFGIDERQR